MQVELRTKEAPSLDRIKKQIADNHRFHQLQPWLQHLTLLASENRILSFGFQQNHLNELFSSDLTALLQEVVGEIYPGQNLSVFIESKPGIALFNRRLPEPTLTFNNFHAGPGNRLALAAAQSVANNPGVDYNPLFIHAPSGFGKSHLLGAIYNSLADDNTRKVYYLHGDDLQAWIVNHPTESVQAHLFHELHSASVFLLDDLDRFANQPGVEAFLLYAFESFKREGRQLVFSSNVSPSSLKDISESLRSRLQWGLVIEIEPLETSAKRDLIHYKAALLRLELTEEIINYLADNTFGNIREVDGILNKLNSHVCLMKRPIDLALVKRTIKDYGRPDLGSITIENVENSVLDHFGLDHSVMVSKSRMRSIAYPRQIAMYLSQILTNSSLEEIGQYFGGRDHSTVKHGCEKIKQLVKTDSAMRILLDKLRKKIEI